MLRSYLHTMAGLFKTEFVIFKQTIHDKFIDLFIWVLSMAAVTVYLLPFFGIERAYGAFIIISMAASAGLFEQFAGTTKLVGDFNGDNITSFYLTLPMPSWLVFASYGLFYTFNCAVITLFVLPIAKLCFWAHLDFAQMSFIKYGAMFMLTSLFYGAFTLWLASMVPNLERIGSVWMRFVFPIWTFGAFQYSYEVLAKVSPVAAHASLLNPMVYLMEGTRAAVLGQEGSLNVWFCAAMTILFTIAFYLHAVSRIRRRLDFV